MSSVLGKAGIGLDIVQSGKVTKLVVRSSGRLRRIGKRTHSGAIIAVGCISNIASGADGQVQVESLAVDGVFTIPDVVSKSQEILGANSCSARDNREDSFLQADVDAIVNVCIDGDSIVLEAIQPDVDIDPMGFSVNSDDTLLLDGEVGVVSLSVEVNVVVAREVHSAIKSQVSVRVQVGGQDGSIASSGSLHLIGNLDTWGSFVTSSTDGAELSLTVCGGGSSIAIVADADWIASAVIASSMIIASGGATDLVGNTGSSSQVIASSTLSTVDSSVSSLTDASDRVISTATMSTARAVTRNKVVGGGHSLERSAIGVSQLGSIEVENVVLASRECA